MTIRDQLVSGIGKIIQNEQVLKRVQSEAVIKAVMKAFTVSTEARELIEAQVNSMVSSLGLVKREELEAMQAQLDALRWQLLELRRTQGETNDE